MQCERITCSDEPTWGLMGTKTRAKIFHANIAKVGIVAAVSDATKMAYLRTYFMTLLTMSQGNKIKMKIS